MPESPVIGMGRASKVPCPVGVVANSQNGLMFAEDAWGLKGGRLHQPVPHPPGPTVLFGDEINEPPYERQVLMGAGLVGCQIRPTLWDLLKRRVNQRVRG